MWHFLSVGGLLGDCPMADRKVPISPDIVPQSNRTSRRAILRLAIARQAAVRKRCGVGEELNASRSSASVRLFWQYGAYISLLDAFACFARRDRFSAGCPLSMPGASRNPVADDRAGPLAAPCRPRRLLPLHAAFASHSKRAEAGRTGFGISAKAAGASFRRKTALSLRAGTDRQEHAGSDRAVEPRSNSKARIAVALRSPR